LFPLGRSCVSRKEGEDVFAVEQAVRVANGEGTIVLVSREDCLPPFSRPDESRLLYLEAGVVTWNVRVEATRVDGASRIHEGSVLEVVVSETFAGSDEVQVGAKALLFAADGKMTVLDWGTVSEDTCESRWGPRVRCHVVVRRLEVGDQIDYSREIVSDSCQ